MSKLGIMRGIVQGLGVFDRTLRTLFDLRHATRREPIDYARTHGSRKRNNRRGKGGR